MNVYKLVLNNFMSFKSLEYEFVKNKPVVVIGKNGAGKSTLIEAIVWILYGKLLRSSDKDDVLRESYGKDCKGKLYISDKEQVYKIIRYRNHAKYNDEFQVWVDGEKEGFRKNDDAQEFLNKKIGMNFDTFLNSIVFGQGKGKFFTTSKESDRRGILEDILGLGIFDKYQKEAKKRKSEASGKIEVADENIRGLNNRIIKLEELKEQSNSSELETLKKELQDKSISDTKLERDAKNIENQIREKYPEEISKKKKISLQELRESWYKAKSKYVVLETESNELVDEIDRIGEIIENPESVLKIGCLCPTCKSPITKSSMGLYTLWIQSEQNKYKNRLKEVAELMITAFNKGRDLQLEVEQSELEYNNIEKNRRILQNLLYEKKASIKAYKRDMDAIREKIEKVKDRGSSSSKDIQKLIVSTQVEVEEGGKLLKRLKRTYSIYEYWVEAFGDKGIKNYIINSVVEILNERANYYLSQLSDGLMEVYIDTMSLTKTNEVRDKISIFVEIDGVKKKFEKVSGGEGRRVDIAVIFALQDIASMNGRKTIDFFICDEGADWLDSSGTDNFVELLNERAKTESVYLISHSDDLKYKFDNIIEVVKEGNKSRLIINGG